MSRVGRKSIPIPEGVKVIIQSDSIDFEGPKGKLTSPLIRGIRAELQEQVLLQEGQQVHYIAADLY